MVKFLCASLLAMALGMPTAVNASDGDTNTATWNFDGLLTDADVNQLSTAIIDLSHETRFDLNNDSLVDFADLSVWVHELNNTWIGDANLDGEFSSADFVSVFGSGKFETGLAAGWGEGDWHADGVFSSGDFVVAFQDGGYERGPRAANLIALPEPSAVWLLGSALIGVNVVARRRRIYNDSTA